MRHETWMSTWHDTSSWCDNLGDVAWHMYVVIEWHVDNDIIILLSLIGDRPLFLDKWKISSQFFDPRFLNHWWSTVPLDAWNLRWILLMPHRRPSIIGDPLWTHETFVKSCWSLNINHRWSTISYGHMKTSSIFAYPRPLTFQNFCWQRSTLRNFGQNFSTPDHRLSMLKVFFWLNSTLRQLRQFNHWSFTVRDVFWSNQTCSPFHLTRPSTVGDFS